LQFGDCPTVDIGKGPEASEIIYKEGDLLSMKNHGTAQKDRVVNK
jgi:hypothetical protein